MAVAIVATEQTVSPVRMLVSVTGLTLGDGITVYRIVDGVRTPIRGGMAESVTDTSFVRVDAELPFGVPVAYVAVVNDTFEYATAPATHTIADGVPVLTDAISGLAASAMIYEWPTLAQQRQASAFEVGGRNIAVLGPVPQPRSSLVLRTADAATKAALLDLLTNATNGIVQVRQPGGVSDVDSYQTVMGVARDRATQRGHNEARYWPLDVMEVDGWAPELEARGWTLQDIANAYTEPFVANNANPFFEVNATNWTLGAGTSFVRSTAQFHEGIASGLLTPTGAAATAEVFSEQTSAIAGDSYQAHAWIRCAVTRSVNLILYWYTGAGAFISQTITPYNVVANTWTEVRFTAHAPATTGLKRVGASMAGTPAAGHLLYLDEIAVSHTLTLKDLADDYATLLAVAQEDWA